MNYRFRIAGFLMLTFAILSGCQFSPQSGRSFQSGDGSGPGWVSSGGEIFSDQSNPWFIQNTKNVSYCIQISEEEISASRSQIQEAIKKALEYWTRQFVEQAPSIRKIIKSGDRLFILGTQKFEESSECSLQTDIVFQFGYKTLTEAQKKQMGNVHRFIGLTVRTHYDPVNLLGRGFIFMGSDQGPNRFRTIDNSKHAVWKYDLVLQLVLAHELGHIFGLTHQNLGLMAEDTPQTIVAKSMIDFLKHAEPPEEPTNIFVAPTVFKRCSLSEESYEWFGIKENECLRFSLISHRSYFDTITNDPVRIAIEVSTAANQWEPFGEIEFKDGFEQSMITFPIKMFLPKEQQVFTEFASQGNPWSDPTLYPYVFGVQRLELEGAGQLKLVRELEPRPIYLRLVPENIQLFAMVGDRIDLIVALNY